MTNYNEINQSAHAQIRERMVTRTISTAFVTCTVANVKERVFEDKQYILEGVNANATEKELLKQVKKYENEGIMICEVKQVNIEQQLYGMLESDFIKYAKPINK